VNVLAFDPGPGETAWAYLTGDRNTAQHLNHGKVPSTPKALLNIIETHPADLYAVETMGMFLPKANAWKGLQRCAVVSGLLIGLLHPRPTFTLPANAPGKGDSWRYRLTGQTRTTDHDIARWLEIILPDLPRTNNHCRDAAGLGVVALRSSHLFNWIRKPHD
jgi:hypothetical protein